jgi:superfamily II DNA or RNA helicase
MDTYAAFLERKKRRAQVAGKNIGVDQVHPMLHDWQAEIVSWACGVGRAAIFADCGLGKTFMQLEWARLMADTTLILAPLSVARQTVREAKKIGIDVSYVRHGNQVTGPGVWITNYEMADQFDATVFGAVVLDESSILKNHIGRTRNTLTQQWALTPYRLACTATPAPNDVTELTNHAEFLSLMPRNEMLAAYFIHDQDGWRLKGHAAVPMYQWMSTWAMAVRRPSDLGYPDEGYDLPPLTIKGEPVDVEVTPDGQLFATDLGGIGGRHETRRNTLEARVERAASLANDPGQWIVWCGLNDEATKVAALIEGAVNVEGSWDADAKSEAMEQFQDGQIRVLVTKPAIAGFGMNFQQCNQMIFLGMSDSYESYYQAIRRCWRFGQTKPVDVRIVVSELEQQIVNNVRSKEQQAAAMTAQLVESMNTAKEAP